MLAVHKHSSLLVLVHSILRIRPVDLRVQYQTKPLGVGVLQPTLSWLLELQEDSVRGEKQTAYRVLVSTSAQGLEIGQADLWDSGKVDTDATYGVIYEGRDLAALSGCKCHWQVMVWDSEGKPSSWSEPEFWSMALLDTSLWQAKWAVAAAAAPFTTNGYTSEGNDLVLPPPKYLRCPFKLDGGIARATVYATARGWYQLRLNGAEVGADFFAPGWTDYNARIYYNTYDVTRLVHEGGNVIGAMLADGWYAGYIGYLGQRNHYGKELALLAQLEVEYEDGRRSVAVVSGSEWTWTDEGPLRHADILMGETYDATRELAGWDMPGYKDDAWKLVRAAARAEHSPVVEPYPALPVRVFETVAPLSVAEPRPGVFVFDMGQNFAGIVQLRVTGAKVGECITIRHAERCNPDGTIYTTNLRTARATDAYTCHGRGGDEVWRPQFTFHGFQYVELTGYPGTPTLEAVTGLKLGSSMQRTGTLEASDATVNTLLGNIYRTQRSNFLEVPTDCPQRDERLGWTGDAQVYVHTACFFTDVRAFFHKWLVDLRDGQGPSGEYPTFVPKAQVATGHDGGPAWADAGVICPWTVYEASGDLRLLEEHYASMARFVQCCIDRSKGGVLPPDTFPCFGDWLNINADTPHDVIYTAFFAHCTNLLSQAAAALGRVEDAARYGEQFQAIAAAFRSTYVDAAGLIKGDTQCSYVLALAFNLLDSAQQWEQAAARLVKAIQDREWHLSTGFVGTGLLMLTLDKIGRNDVAYRLLHNDTFPSWGYCIKNGATSIWERWNGWTHDKGFFDPGMNSFAHYSFGAVGGWMFRAIGGLRPLEPGYRRVAIAPQPGGRLTWAAVRFQSASGRIDSRWALTDGEILLEVSIPPNVSGEVHVPGVGGNQVFESGQIATMSEGVRFLRNEGNAAVFEVASGSYKFSARFSSGSESLSEDWVLL